MYQNNIERTIREKIPFLEWARLSDEMVQRITGFDFVNFVAISPDVHSLHIVWCVDGEISHEIADFPYSDDFYRVDEIEDWLDTEILCDAYETFNYPSDLLSDLFDGIKLTDMPIIEQF